MKKPKLVLLDIDHTLFNSQTYKETAFSRIADFLAKDWKKQDIEQNCYTMCNNQIRKLGFFDPEAFADMVASYYGRQQDKQHVLSLLLDASLFEEHAYKEVVAVVTALSKIAEVGIYSQGLTKFQERKIASFRHLFTEKHVYISQDKKQEMARIFANYKEYAIFFVDDILPILALASTIDSTIFTIWIRRGEYAERMTHVEGFSPSAQIGDLQKVIDIVKQN